MMLTTNFGIEIETTGITREQAARTVATFLGGTVERTYDNYDTHKVHAPDGRVWKIVRDGSITCQKRVNGRIVPASTDYSVELVSPILNYRNDIETLQEIVRELRRAGSFTSKFCGIHIHLDGAGHTPRSVRNFVNIIASKNDLLEKALQIEPERARYCKKLDSILVEKMNTRKPKTMAEIEDIWYEGYNEIRTSRYHNSRYKFLNLHSLFNGHGTIEIRGFNSVLHSGKIRSYIALCLALNHQALTQKSVSAKKPQEENMKFAMRTFLNRLGLIGEEFANCRKHLTSHLPGSSAWRHRAA